MEIVPDKSAVGYTRSLEGLVASIGRSIYSKVHCLLVSRKGRVEGLPDITNNDWLRDGTTSGKFAQRISS